MSRLKTIAKEIVDGLSDAAVLVDAEQRLAHFNRQFVQMSAERPSQLRRIAETPGKLFELAALQGPAREEYERCLRSGRAMRYTEIPMTNAAGEEFVTLQAFIPLHGADEAPEGVIIALRDLTPEARLQSRYKELLARERARADELERRVEERTKQLAAALEKVTELSLRDPLTGLLNRRALSDHAEQALEMARRHNRSLAFFMLDLDHFKSVNDQYGHMAGDAMLKSVASSLTSSVRSTDKVARFGGEEFAVLLTETVAESVLEIAERCRRRVEQLPINSIIPEKHTPQTVSLGIALFPDHGDTMDRLISCADAALYAAKESGRNRVVTYGSDVAVAQEQAPAERRQSVLAAVADQPRQQVVRGILSRQFAVTVCSTLEQAKQALEQQQFDVVLADDALGETGAVELLNTAVGTANESLRILTVADSEAYLASQGRTGNLADRFVVHADLERHLLPVVEEALLQAKLTVTNIPTIHELIRPVSRSAAAALKGLLERGELRFAYQPIFDARSGTAIGYEALCRPSDPELSNPSDFFETAAVLGSVWEVGRLVRRTIAAQIPSLPADCSVFINLHPAELADPVLLDGEPTLLELSSRIVFEVTERSAIPDADAFIERVSTLRDQGFRVAVDDLGAGYASLNSVAMLRPDFVKVDRTLVSKIHTSSIRQRLVRSIVHFSAHEKIGVVAEGVETQDEQDTVVALGCDYLQGFHLGRPSFLDHD